MVEALAHALVGARGRRGGGRSPAASGRAAGCRRRCCAGAPPAGRSAASSWPSTTKNSACCSRSISSSTLTGTRQGVLDQRRRWQHGGVPRRRRCRRAPPACTAGAGAPVAAPVRPAARAVPWAWLRPRRPRPHPPRRVAVAACHQAACRSRCQRAHLPTQPQHQAQPAAPAARPARSACGPAPRPESGADASAPSRHDATRHRRACVFRFGLQRQQPLSGRRRRSLLLRRPPARPRPARHPARPPPVSRRRSRSSGSSSFSRGAAAAAVRFGTSRRAAAAAGRALAGLRAPVASVLVLPGPGAYGRLGTGGQAQPLHLAGRQAAAPGPDAVPRRARPVARRQQQGQRRAPAVRVGSAKRTNCREIEPPQPTLRLTATSGSCTTVALRRRTRHSSRLVALRSSDTANAPGASRCSPTCTSACTQAGVRLSPASRRSGTARSSACPKGIDSGMRPKPRADAPRGGREPTDGEDRDAQGPLVHAWEWALSTLKITLACAVTNRPPRRAAHRAAAHG